MNRLEHKEISSIIVKYINGTISSEEEELLNKWLRISPGHEALLEKYRSDNFFADMNRLYVPGEEKKLYKIIHKQIRAQKKSSVSYFLKVAAILVILTTAGITTYQLIPTPNEKEITFADLKPGNMQATLYLSNGEQVALNTSKKVLPLNGDLNKITIDGTRISFLELEHSKELLDNESRIVVPRGGEYQLQLNDRSEIYLNSESEIFFPTIFSDSLREVYFNGEAYFQVAADTSHPFMIHTFWGIVKVTGTAFNLRCYKDEKKLQLTLEKGTVHFRSYDEHEWKELTPGEQLKYSATDKKSHITEVDTYLYTSWQKGVYAFKSTPLKKIMSDLSRWYNITVTYQKSSLQNITFTGEVKRYESFDEIVKMLELTQTVHFEWKDSKIHIIN